ncbi:MAG: hypothetical protein AAFY34_13065 [Pseudomonadota bacterium]
MKKIPIAKTLILGTIFAVSVSASFRHVTAPDGFEPLPTISSGAFGVASTQSGTAARH